MGLGFGGVGSCTVLDSCEEGYIVPENAPCKDDANTTIKECLGVDIENAIIGDDGNYYSPPQACTKVNQTGFRCLSTPPYGYQCVRCDLNEQGCRNQTEEDCYEYCNTLESGRTYHCNENNLCEPVYDGKGEYTNWNDCIRNCEINPDNQKQESYICKTKSGKDGVDTAIGCIPIEQTNLISFILRWFIGIGSGVAFMLIILSSFLIMTSQGNPAKIQTGKEILISAITGLLLIIFSVFLLRNIGTNILQIWK